MGAQESVEGYRVIDVQPNSPASEAGLRSYLDLIIAANGVRLTSGPAFVNILQKSNKCRVFLRVYNILEQKIRECVVIPNNEWGGEGSLGSTIRFESWSPEQGNVHVLHVYPDSPASKAGLVAEEDFILGTDDFSAPSIDMLARALTGKTETTLFVYSKATGAVRKLGITLDPNWGGKGVLGCDIADGLLHIIVAAPAGTAESTDVSTTATVETSLDVSVGPPPPRQSGEQASAAPPQTQEPPAEVVELAPPPKPLSEPLRGKYAQPKPQPQKASYYTLTSPPSKWDDQGWFVGNVMDSPFVKAPEQTS